MDDDPRQSPYRSRTYPVQEDMAFQDRVWRFEHWGWCVLLVIVVMALLGAFSRGPLSARELHSSDGRLRVEYEMIHRNGSTNPMTFNLTGKINGPVELELSGDLLDGFSIEAMQPDPIKAVSAGQGIKLFLQADSQGQATLHLTLRADGLGRYSSHAAVPGSEPIDFSQFILP